MLIWRAFWYNLRVKHTGKIACAAVASVIAATAPLAAEANAGTPLIFSGALHLFFGNFVIGVVEGSLLCFLYPRRASGAVVAFMVVANYLEEGTTTRHHQESLRERYRVMASHYGQLSTLLMHCWFAVRQFISR